MSAVYVGIAVTVIGAGLSAYGASEQASAQKEQFKYQAAIAANNAKIEEWKRSDAVQRGEIEAQNAMRQQAQLIGQQRVALAASGQDVNQGSALDLLASTKFLGQQDVNTIQSNAAREAWGYDVSAADQLASQKLLDWKRKTIDPTAIGVMTGLGSLLSSASSFAAAGRSLGSSGTVSSMKINKSYGGWQ